MRYQQLNNTESSGEKDNFISRILIPKECSNAPCPAFTVATPATFSITC